MKKIFIPIVFVFAIFETYAQKGFTQYIDPTIGNVAQFLVPTYPTMHLPNQMVRMFPVKYDYLSDQVTGFPLQVVSHRSPGILQMKVGVGEMDKSSWSKKMNIDHDLEIIRPWFYSTYLIDDNIRVSFTPGEKCAVYHIEFPSAVKKNILIQGSNDMVGASGDGSSFTLEEKIKYETKGVNPVIHELSAYIFGTVTDEHNQQVKEVNFQSEKGRFSMSLAQSATSAVMIKYAVSYISNEQAKINFNKELATADFDNLVEAGKKKWGKVIDQIQAEGGTEAQKRTFYTALYRTYERMIDVNEGGKYYSGYDGKVHESNRPFYVDDWIWDTYRAQHPLRTILNPQMENDVLNSYTLMYEQSGWMPTFPQIHGNHMCMNSYHSSAIFIDGYRKGLRDYPVEKAFEGIKKNLTEATFIPWRQGVPKQKIDDFYHEKGYFPALRPGQNETEPMVDIFEKRQAVAVTLGISYDAWALAELAKELGRETDYQKFSAAAQNYKNLWQPDYRLFMPRDDQGKWMMINPKSDGGPGYRDYYDENNGWTYAWDVQHDIPGLLALLGGKKAAEERLDQCFREPLEMKKNLFYVNGANSTGMVGQFSMGNEPSFHIPYLYNYFGAPWKTQKMTRFLLDVWFKDNIFGIPGDEDGGGMSAFVVFTSMGLYPVTPGLPLYNITSPVFEKTTILLTNGKKFTVLAKGASKSKKYIQKASINGQEIDSPFITHDQIMAGGTLELVLSELPNKDWGKDAVTPSFTAATARSKHAAGSKFMSYKGLVMAGYQGWFNCEGDGADRGWTHYAKGNKFEDGNCKIDLWPAMDEYKIKYKTPFKFADGAPAYVFSSYDESTVDLHFKWMKEYGIDGVFVQRFFSVLTSPDRMKHNDKVLASAIKAASKYGIAICLMYDIGSMEDSKYKLVQEDWKHLVDDLRLTNQGKKTTYLFHNGKPLVAFWGISAGTRESGHIPEIFDIMDFFKNDPVYGGCSIHLGIPSRWRTLGSDTKGDPRLLEVLQQADVIHPWLVGRYNEKSYESYRQENIIDDVKWCKENGKSYAPTVYPGFSWYNMKPNEISDKIPRNKGEFYWKQIAGAIESGAEMIYVAMFDEIDEGTAIFKCAQNVPVGKSVFVPMEKELPSDHYLWLTGMAGKMLRKEIPFSKVIPKRD